jgi:hypothetical protein
MYGMWHLWRDEKCIQSLVTKCNGAISTSVYMYILEDIIKMDLKGLRCVSWD